MTRGAGRNQARHPDEVQPNTATGRDIGLSDRQTGDPSPIPGGRPHIRNYPTVRQSVPTPVPRPEFRGVMAHGVPPGPQTAHERAEAMRGPNSAHDPRPEFHDPGSPPPPPVPVYVVENPNSQATVIDSSMRRYTVPATGSEPIHLVGTNSDRVEIKLLNEDSSHNILVGYDKASVQNGTTSVCTLPKSMSSYLTLPTKKDLWVISADSGTPIISAIETFERNDGQRQ